VLKGYSSRVHLAVIMDEQELPTYAYIKAFPIKSKGIANELLGRLLARVRGMAVAPRAWILLVPTERLRELHPNDKWPKDETYPCWASEALHPPDQTPPSIQARDADAWADRLVRWPQLHAAVALNEWIANKDSNSGNLIPLERNEFGMLDFADILGGRDWDEKKLKALDYVQNKLTFLAWNGMPAHEDALLIIEHGHQHMHALSAIREELEDWWSALLKKGEVRAGLKFLQQRANAQTLMRSFAP
jgi:hypothetical protein